jgi:8-oxo-dGTP diphosphatase
VLNIKQPLLTVDAVISCEDKAIVLIRRKNPPYQGYWALPGGFVNYGETVESAAIREVKEETGLEIDLYGILGVYSDPERDPRGHVVSVCFMAVENGGKLKADTDASEVACFKTKSALKLDLAFDHKNIIKDALEFII